MTALCAQEVRHSSGLLPFVLHKSFVTEKFRLTILCSQAEQTPAWQEAPTERLPRQHPSWTHATANIYSLFRTLHGCNILKLGCDPYSGLGKEEVSLLDFLLELSQSREELTAYLTTLWQQKKKVKWWAVFEKHISVSMHLYHLRLGLMQFPWCESWWFSIKLSSNTLSLPHSVNITQIRTRILAYLKSLTALLVNRKKIITTPGTKEKCTAEQQNFSWDSG